jgi:hypothetical protein
MATRKAFLFTIAASGTAVAAPAAVAGEPVATPTAVPTPKATPTPKPPTPAAAAWAERMRKFDATLSDKEVAVIATSIDQAYDLGTAINPKGRRLKNSDEPISPFEVES